MQKTDSDFTSPSKINNIIIPPLRHFTILGQKNAQNMSHYYTVEQGRAKIRTEEEQQNGRTKRMEE